MLWSVKKAKQIQMMKTVVTQPQKNQYIRFSDQSKKAHFTLGNTGQVLSYFALAMRTLLYFRITF